MLTIISIILIISIIFSLLGCQTKINDHSKWEERFHDIRRSMYCTDLNYFKISAIYWAQSRFRHPQFQSNSEAVRFQVQKWTRSDPEQNHFRQSSVPFRLGSARQSNPGWTLILTLDILAHWDQLRINNYAAQTFRSSPLQSAGWGFEDWVGEAQRT